MAGPFYVDLDSPGSWQGRDGTNSASPWLGISGLQKAFDTVDVGEICYLTGTGDLSKFYSLPYDNEEGGHLTDGEVVSWDSGEWTDGSTGTGVVHWMGADMATPIELELLTGTIPANDDELKGATSGNYITVNGTCTRKSLNIDTKEGTNAGGFIKFIGVDSDWSGRTTRAIIDGASATDQHGIDSNGKDMYWFENVEVKRIAGTSKHGFQATGYGPEGWVFVNCCANNCSGSGFGSASGYFKSVVFLRCVAYSNGFDGFSCGAQAMYYLCCSRQNTRHGYLVTGMGVLYGCIGWYNTTNGSYGASGFNHYVNCVADNNQTSGISIGTVVQLGANTFIGNRITSQNQAGTDSGIDCTSDPALLGWNYFEDNGDDPADDIVNDTLATLIYEEETTTDSNRYTQADANEGYVSHPALPTAPNLATNYADATDPTLRRTAITIPWS
jgi:hypothetical protein